MLLVASQPEELESLVVVNHVKKDKSSLLSVRVSDPVLRFGKCGTIVELLVRCSFRMV